MTTTVDVDAPNIYMQLRNKAEAKLEAGSTPTKNHWSLGIDALRLLHQLSSNPDSAQDALKLLHELQVHQVELDLQHEEIAANEQALVEELTLCREFFDSAPLAYFLVDREGIVNRGNLAAAALFGMGQNDLAGQRIDAILAPESRPQLVALLQRVAESGANDSCMAVAAGSANDTRRLLLLASGTAKRESVLLACCEYPGEA